jgi:hypothetical protein
MMYSVVSYCPHCGAPIYTYSGAWGATTPPPVTYTCDCRLRLGLKSPIGFIPAQPRQPFWPPYGTAKWECPDWTKDWVPFNGDPKKNSIDYHITDEQREAWKRAVGRLTGKIPHGEDGETLSEYISRKRDEER